jgi:hypothetical protein
METKFLLKYLLKRENKMRKKIIFTTAIIVGLSLFAILLLLPSCSKVRKQARYNKVRNEPDAVKDYNLLQSSEKPKAYEDTDEGLKSKEENRIKVQDALVVHEQPESTIEADDIYKLNIQPGSGEGDKKYNQRAYDITSNYPLQ